MDDFYTTYESKNYKEEPEEEREPNPTDLLSRKLVERKNAGVVVVVTCGVNAEGSGYDEDCVEDNCNPINVLKNRPAISAS